MSVIVPSILYVGDNIQLVNTMLNLSDPASEKSNYSLSHASRADDIAVALAEKKYSHFICDLPISQELVDQIATDFPSLETTYIMQSDATKATELFSAMEGLVSDEIKETLDYLSIPVYFKNRKDQYIACNSYFSHLFGKTHAQVIGKTAKEVFPEELSAEINKIDQKVFVDQQVYFYECSISDPAGQQCDVVFRKESVANGKIQIGMVFDVTEVNGAKALLEQERAMLRATTDISPDFIFFKDLERRYLGCNKQFEKFVGRSEPEILGKKGSQFFQPEQATMCKTQEQDVLLNKNISFTEEYLKSADGELHFVEMKKVPVVDNKGDVQGLIGIGRDITAYQRMQERLKIADTAFENSKEALVVTDQLGNIIAVNKALCASSSFSKSELLGTNIKVFASNRHECIEAALHKGESWQGEIICTSKTGKLFFVWLDVYIVRHAEEGIVNRIYSLTDLNQPNNVDLKVQYLAKYDPLTGLFNRIALFNRLEGTIARATFNQLTMAVILVDINGFKAINEQYGHHAGDMILREIAARFKNCVYGKDTVARFGDDEFVIVVDELANEQDVAVIVQRIAAQFDRNFEIDHLSAHISATIGIALCPDDGTDVDTLIGNAENAMLRGKPYYSNALDGDALIAHEKKMKDRKYVANVTAYHFYTGKLTEHSRQQVQFEEELKQALALEQFELYYQPQYDLSKRQVVAVEAVLCWNHQQRGPLYSDCFSSLAGYNGLAFPIALMTIRKAAIQAVTWQKAAINFGRIALSLTEAQLSHSSLTAELQTILQETKCARQWLEFEVEEATFKTDNPVVYENLLNLGKMGIALCIDNFGEEHPLFRIFEQLSVDKFKLSKHISEGSSAHFVNCAVQDSVQVLARSLGLTVVSGSLGTDGAPEVTDKLGMDGRRLINKGMKASEVTFYLRCNKRR